MKTVRKFICISILASCLSAALSCSPRVEVKQTGAGWVRSVSMPYFNITQLVFESESGLLSGYNFKNGKGGPVPVWKGMHCNIIYEQTYDDFGTEKFPVVTQVLRLGPDAK